MINKQKDDEETWRCVSSRRGWGRGNGLCLLTMEEVHTLPTMKYCGSLQLLSPPPFDLESSNQEVKLRDYSNLSHPTDGRDFISCRNNNNKEIGHASLHDIETADHAYAVDYHD
jgi:hypothetical protein